MSWLRRVVSSLRGQRLEEELDRELEFHLAMRARDHSAAGAPAEEARRRALDRFGSLARTREACRDESSFAWLPSLGQDLRYAARNLRKHAGFTAAAAACLAIGIAANTAVFSFVNAFLFPTLPPRVFLLQRAFGVSYPELRDWQKLNPVFDELFSYTPGERLTIGRGMESTHVLGESVSANYFQALGVVPAAGRLFAPGDDARPVAVLGYRFWREHFAANPATAGQTLWINQEAYSIAGIAPPSFQGMLAPWGTDVWVTQYLHRDALADLGPQTIGMGARLKAGVTELHAAAAMNSLVAELARRYPDPRRPAHDPLLLTRRSGLSGSPVWVVFLAMSALLTIVAGIILLISCANVAGLLIARAAVRRREILIRLSLGAGRGRLVRQLLIESMLLGFLGAAAGVAIAFAAGDALAGLMPQSISGGFRFQHAIDIRVLAFTLLLALLSAALSGLLPALRASGQNLAAAGRSHSPSGARTPRFRQWLIVGQVAASVLVLATAGVFVRSFQKSLAVDPGFDFGHLLTVKLDLREMRYPPARNTALYAQLRDRISALPGVVAASLTELLPLGDQHVLAIPGQGEIATAEVDSRYFRAMGIPLLRGREPLPNEPDAAVVNDALARRLWPGQDPVGQTIRRSGGASPLHVTGLTATGRYWSLNERPRPFLYMISEHPAAPVLCLAVRTAGPPQTLSGTVAREIARLDPLLPPIYVQNETDRLRAHLQPQRAAAGLLSILGLAALGLAITGLYALLAQLVAQRTAEIAVRLALGASRGLVAGMLLRRSALLVSAGAALGIGAATLVARLVAGAAGPVSALDAFTVVAIVLLLAVVAAAATLVPACRAARIAPAAALRSE